MYIILKVCSAFTHSDVFIIIVDIKLKNLVTNNDNVPFFGQSSNGLQLFERKNFTSWIVGIIQYDTPSSVIECRRQFF